MKRDTILTLKLPRGNGLEDYPVREPRHFEKPLRPFTRRAYAAAHVVADPLSAKEPWLEAAIDWDATIAYRRHLWSWGFGVAEAMDTAQRGMGLDWANALELTKKTVEESRNVPGAVVASGAGTDHLPQAEKHSIAKILAAYEEQCAAIEKPGGRIILMASRALAEGARSADDYATVYDRSLGQVREPVLIHWLGVSGALVGAALMGLADAHAASVSMATLLAGGRLPASTAVTGIILALTTNMAVKIPTALVAGGPSYGRLVTIGVGLLLAGLWSGGYIGQRLTGIAISWPLL